MKTPNKPGLWRLETTGEEIEVYSLDPVGGMFCIWGPDVGITYTGVGETQGVWSSDEWQGHIPINWYDDIGPWTLVRDLD